MIDASTIHHKHRIPDAGVTDGADVTVTVPDWETATRLSLGVIDGECRSQEPQSQCKGSRTEAMADGQAGPGWIHGRRGRVSGNVRVGVALVRFIVEIEPKFRM